MAKKLSWKDAITKVLQERGGASAMHYSDIADAIMAEDLVETAGATPAQTVNVIVSNDIRDNGNKSTFVRVKRGEYGLRAPLVNAIAPVPVKSSGLATATGKSPNAASTTASADTAVEQEGGLVAAFGMFWRRDLVEWTSKPKLLGKGGETANEVDFGEQSGVYVLYDRHRIVYVGQALGSTVGTLRDRLSAHNKGRMQGRWDRFSWFGFRPVLGDGALGAHPDTCGMVDVLDAIEAILIEAAEPVLNRRQGENLKGKDYLQVPDPKRVKKAEIVQKAMELAELS